MSLFLLNALKSSEDAEATKSQEAQDSIDLKKPIGYTSDVNIEDNFSIYIRAMERVVAKLEVAINGCSEMGKLIENPALDEDQALRQQFLEHRVNYTNSITEVKDFINAFITELIAIQDRHGKEYTQLLEEHFKALLYAVDLMCLFENVEYGYTALKLAKFIHSAFIQGLEKKNSIAAANASGINDYDDVVINQSCDVGKSGDSHLETDLVDIRRY